MGRHGSSAVPGVIVGLALGATALVIYRRRAALQSLIGSRVSPRVGSRVSAALPPGTRALTVSGGSTMQTMLSTATETVRALSTSLQAGPQGLAEQARRYVESVRKEVDVAIAEGRLAADQTRRELEARLDRAKSDPASARTAFDR